MKKINFYTADVTSNLKNKKTIKELLAYIFKTEKKDWDVINYIFCSDAYLIQINNQFLQHDFYTDIITFPVSLKNQPIEAEIYVSIERIKENAKTYKVSYQNELLRVMIHGILHLCGYDDKTSNQKTKIRALENKYIERFGNVPREN